MSCVQANVPGLTRAWVMLIFATGRAPSMWVEGDAVLDHFEEFTRRFRAVFDHPPEGRAAGERLFHLRQGTRSAQEFALDFRTLAAGAGWNDRALIDQYRCSLREDVRLELACRDTSLPFDQLVDRSIQLDNRLATRGRPERVCPFHPPATLLQCPRSWEVLRSGRPEEVPSRAPSVAAKVTLPLGAA